MTILVNCYREWAFTLYTMEVNLSSHYVIIMRGKINGKGLTLEKESPRAFMVGHIDPFLSQERGTGNLGPVLKNLKTAAATDPSEPIYSKNLARIMIHQGKSDLSEPDPRLFHIRTTITNLKNP